MASNLYIYGDKCENTYPAPDADIISQPPLTKSEALEYLSRFTQNFISSLKYKAQSRRALYILRERKGYIALGHNTFEEMVQARLGIKRSYATEMINATRVEREIAPFVPI